MGYLEKNCSDNGRYLFRGQLDKDKLLPRLFRSKTKIQPKTPETEKAMFDDFKRRGRPFLKIEPQSEYEWLALAQHHGMPTRLLDWTSSALAALWFTVTDTRKNDNGAIWVLKYEEADIVKPRKDDMPFDTIETKIFFPTHIVDRFIAQGGWFTVHKYERKIKSLDEEGNYENKLIKKLIVPRDSFSNIRFLLNRCGLNKVTLFPDFDGLCEHIAWRNSKEYFARKANK